MSGLIRREPRGETGDIFGRLDRMFEEWTRMVPFRAMPIPRWRDVEDLIRVEEYREGGTLVIRADLPGIDPDSDVEVTVLNGMLRIEAERHEDDRGEEQGYVRQELRYGALSRSLPLPEGVTVDDDITATYKNGVLEIRVPEPQPETAKKIAINKSWT